MDQWYSDPFEFVKRSLLQDRKREIPTNTVKCIGVTQMSNGRVLVAIEYLEGSGGILQMKRKICRLAPTWLLEEGSEWQRWAEQSSRTIDFTFQSFSVYGNDSVIYGHVTDPTVRMISMEFQDGSTFNEVTTETTFIMICPGMSGVRPKAIRTFSSENQLLEEIQL